VQPKLAATNFFHPSSGMITSDESTVYIVHFNDSSKLIKQIEQCKSDFTLFTFDDASKVNQR
jgi:hypothetical protein